jgi:hypothetical protein
LDGSAASMPATVPGGRRGPSARVARRAAVAIALAGALAGALAAAPRARAEDTVSVGVGVDPARAGSGAGDLLMAGRNAAPLSFHLQVALLPRLRLEVSAAYFHVARDAAHTPPGSSSYDFASTVAGFGAVYYFALPKPFGFYAGGRLTIALFTGTFKDEPFPLEAKRLTVLDAFLAPVAGGEVALSRRLFFGTEVQLPVPVTGDHSLRTASGADGPNLRGTHLAVNSIVFLRYLLF